MKLDSRMKVSISKLLAVVFVAAFIFAFVYRWTEQFGVHACTGCAHAIGVSALAAAASILPLFVGRQSNAQSFFLKAVIGSAVRVLMTLLCIIIVALNLNAGRMWFFAYVGFFYCLSLIAETLFAVRVLSRDRWEM